MEIYSSPTMTPKDMLETIAKTQKTNIMKKSVDPEFKMGGASVN